MYGIDIYNSKNRHITISTKKEKKFSLDIYQISAQDPLKELLNEFREGQFSTTLTSKKKLSILKMLRNNRPTFSIGEEPLGKIRGHDIELYLDVERPYPPMLRRPPYPEIQVPYTQDTTCLRQTGKSQIHNQKDCMKGFHQNGVKPKSMKLLRIICHMGIYEYTRRPFGIKNAPVHFQRMMDTISQEEILEGWMVVYIDDIII
ncbi:hypothetical protein O181_079474 [Austropuccinia psidii MF-1]|uniref:Reverse transcriptase domain-containing protein n=1 Tax=Austropuccinia psidii MF-1 TaxID=1389203 RepID=A0A9Q3FIJ9_9BASI|nr:hypothetical protein [Austropuccinia psidii MF-1]